MAHTCRNLFVAIYDHSAAMTNLPQWPPTLTDALREELLVLDDVERVSRESTQLQASSAGVSHRLNGTKSSLQLTSVPRIMGLLNATHVAKWVLSSARVRPPLPISIMSMSACASNYSVSKMPYV